LLLITFIRQKTVRSHNIFSAEPVISFERQQFIVNEPIFKGDISTLIVPVIRRGDLSEVSEVIVHSKDGSARAGRDYNGFSRGKC